MTLNPTCSKKRGNEFRNDRLACASEIRRDSNILTCIVCITRVKEANWSDSWDVVSECNSPVRQDHILLRNVEAIWSIGLEKGGIAKEVFSNLLELHRLTSLTKSYSSKYSKPNEAVNERAEETEKNHVSHRSSFRDASNEESNETAPRSPPSHVKDGPRVHPPLLCGTVINSTSFSLTKLTKSIGPEVNEEHVVLKVVTNRLNHEIQLVRCPVQHKDCKQEENAKEKGDITQVLDSNG